MGEVRIEANITDPLGMSFECAGWFRGCSLIPKTDLTVLVRGKNEGIGGINAGDYGVPIEESFSDFHLGNVGNGHAMLAGTR